MGSPHVHHRDASLSNGFFVWRTMVIAVPGIKIFNGIGTCGWEDPSDTEAISHRIPVPS